MRRLIQLAYRLQRLSWKLFRPATRGVKIMLIDDNGAVLLIRNSYGASDLFVLPGGGVRPWERPEDAARREVREEVGCELEVLALVSTHLNCSEGKRDTVYLFEAKPTGAARADGIEIAEARYFPLDALPKKLSPATARRLAERRGDLRVDHLW